MFRADFRVSRQCLYFFSNAGHKEVLRSLTRDVKKRLFFRHFQKVATISEQHFFAVQRDSNLLIPPSLCVLMTSVYWCIWVYGVFFLGVELWWFGFFVGSRRVRGFGRTSEAASLLRREILCAVLPTPKAKPKGPTSAWPTKEANVLASRACSPVGRTGDVRAARQAKRSKLPAP